MKRNSFTPKMHPVDSSNIKSIGFQKNNEADETGILRVEFNHGNLYEYFPVKESVYNLLLESKSKGSFFKKHIQDKTSISYKKII